MIILDTNVLSALMQPSPNPQVKAWLDQFGMEQMWLTSITVMEIEFGIALLPQGKRREALQNSFHTMLRQGFVTHIIEFDDNAALVAAQLFASCHKQGRNQEVKDMQIAGIAYCKGAMLATRNTKHFQDLEIELINPFEA